MVLQVVYLLLGLMFLNSGIITRPRMQVVNPKANQSQKHPSSFFPAFLFRGIVVVTGGRGGKDSHQ